MLRHTLILILILILLLTDCCNKSHTVRLPNKKKEGVSTSKLIDTLGPSTAGTGATSKTSELKVATIHTAYKGGYFFLNIEHVPLPRQELVRRGGDKVKILGISSC